MRNTFKNRLTRAYAVGFFVSSALCFAVIYGVQRHFLLKALNKKLDYFANEFQYEYLSAEMFSPQLTLLVPDKIPASCSAALRREYPDYETVCAILNSERRAELFGKDKNGGVLRFVFSRDNSRVESAVSIPEADRVAHMDFEFNEESYGEGKNRFFFLLLTPDNELLARSPFGDEYVPKFLQRNLKLKQNEKHARNYGGHFTLGVPGYVRNNGVRMRTLRHTLHDGNILFLAANLTDIDRNLNRLLGIFCAGLAGMLTVSLGIGRFIAGGVSSAVNRVSAAAREIGESGDYSKRVSCDGESLEIESLAEAFNGMTGKTERLVGELKTISENIAHDLRTPLTRMRGKAEVSLFAGDEPELAGVVAEECGDMLEMINTMLEITQTEYRFDSARMTRADFVRIVSRSLELFSTIAEDRQITLKCDFGNKGEIPFLCHESKIQRMIANLLDNAFKFTPPGGTVSVALSQNADRVLFSVSDTGCGISAADQAHVFERFFRSAASRTLPGNGLGLSLVRAVVLAHRGEINLQSSSAGTAFFINFPC